MDNNRLTGSYYTSKKVAQYMTNWAIVDKDNSFLEPSFGDGVFLDAAIQRYNELGNAQPNILGVELQPTVYSKYIDNADVSIGGGCMDFLTYKAQQPISSVVGNPPYVTLRNLEESARTEAINTAADNKVKMLTSGSLWMPFIIHSTSLLEFGGRLAFVLPFEFTYVKYAYPLWSYLSSHFGLLKIIRVHEDFFPDVDVETIIFMAENKGGTTNVVDYVIYDSTNDMLNDNSSLNSPSHLQSIRASPRPA